MQARPGNQSPHVDGSLGSPESSTRMLGPLAKILSVDAVAGMVTAIVAVWAWTGMANSVNSGPSRSPNRAAKFWRAARAAGSPS